MHAKYASIIASLRVSLTVHEAASTIADVKPIIAVVQKKLAKPGSRKSQVMQRCAPWHRHGMQAEIIAASIKRKGDAEPDNPPAKQPKADDAPPVPAEETKPAPKPIANVAPPVPKLLSLVGSYGSDEDEE